MHYVDAWYNTFLEHCRNGRLMQGTCCLIHGFPTAVSIRVADAFLEIRRHPYTWRYTCGSYEKWERKMMYAPDKTPYYQPGVPFFSHGGATPDELFKRECDIRQVKRKRRNRVRDIGRPIVSELRAPPLDVAQLFYRNTVPRHHVVLMFSSEFARIHGRTLCSKTVGVSRLIDLYIMQTGCSVKVR